MKYIILFKNFLSLVILYNLNSISSQFNQRNLIRTLKNNLEIENYGPLNATDYSHMQKTFDEFKSLLTNIDNVNSNSDGFLRKSARINNHTDSVICRGCLWIFNHFHDMVHKYYNKVGIFEFIKFICKHIFGLTHKACDGYINNYAPVIFDSLLDHYFTGEYICTFSRICSYSHLVILDADDYARKLLEDKPINITKPDIDENANTWRVLHVTDIHTDLQYAEGSTGDCQDPTCCRNTSILNNFDINKNENKAGKWGYVGKCDLPLRTLVNFLEVVVNDIKPDFIIWTGDNPSHAEWEKSTQQEIYKISTFFTNYLIEKFNTTVPVYPSLGNHEKFPADQFYPFDSIKENQLLNFFGDLWKNWLGQDAYQEFVNYGHYTKKHLNSNLRIISYNCLYCDTMNFYLIKNPNDPNSQIDWLEKTLRSSEANNEVVYLIGHISAGDTSLLSECAKRYKALIDRFSYIIRGQFSGHTHFDEIKILHEYFNKDKVSGVVFIAPSLTTHSYFNPSFRLFEIDSKTKIPKDYLQYRLNITKANQGDGDPVWEINYRASEFFGLKYLNDFDTINKFTMKIMNDKDIFLKVCRAFFADGSQIGLCLKNKRIPKYLSCRFTNDIFNDFFKCINWFSWNHEDYNFKILNILGGQWYQRLPDYEN